MGYTLAPVLRCVSSCARCSNMRVCEILVRSVWYFRNLRFDIIIAPCLSRFCANQTCHKSKIESRGKPLPVFGVNMEGWGGSQTRPYVSLGFPLSSREIMGFVPLDFDKAVIGSLPYKAMVLVPIPRYGTTHSAHIGHNYSSRALRKKFAASTRRNKMLRYLWQLNTPTGGRALPDPSDLLPTF